MYSLRAQNIYISSWNKPAQLIFHEQEHSSILITRHEEIESFRTN